jgi:hypothetical protein
MEQQGYTENAKHKHNAPSPPPEFPKIRPAFKAIIGGKQIIAKHKLDSCTLALWATVPIHTPLL